MLRAALVAAVVLITAFLIALWRRIVPVGLVLAPLLLSNVVTIGIMSASGIAFNFVNVVVVPLLLGIGVDSGIHLVHRAETLARTPGGGDLLGSTTARAVFYSALTTTVSFGTLALSSHPLPFSPPPDPFPPHSLALPHSSRPPGPPPLNCI